jgi:ABC-type phosphate transport system substrate-binding protein
MLKLPLAGGVQLYGGGVSDGLNLFNQITYQYKFYSDVTSVTYYAASTSVAVQYYRQGAYDFMAVDTGLPDALLQEGFIQLPVMASALVIYHSLNISSTLVPYLLIPF